MRLLEVLQRSTAFLQERGVESPRLQAECILAHVLRRPRLQLYLEFDRILQEPELSAARETVLRRARRVPLQHLLGTVSFCGLELEVSPAALIPRPETELLAARAWTWLQERFDSNLPLVPCEPGPATPPSNSAALPTRPALRALDWGTGTGCLAIALAHHVPAVTITALDISTAALDLARRNAVRHACAERITFIESDGCAQLPRDARFELIVANPPYIPTAEWPTLQPEVRDHDPRTALDGGPDGLDAYRKLADELPSHCQPGAAVLLEFGDGQALPLSQVLEARGWIVAEVHRDYSGRERFLLAKRAD